VIGSIWRMADRWLGTRGGISEGGETLALVRLFGQTRFANRLEEFRDKVVLLVTHNQLDTVWALVELDGVARRIIICPPDATEALAGALFQIGGAEILVADGGPLLRSHMGTALAFELLPAEVRRGMIRRLQPTEWVLPTSGTSGPPKLVVHTLATLCAAFSGGHAPVEPIAWATFYDIRRFGGLQILLRTLAGGGSLLLAGAQPMAEFLRQAGKVGVTHISGTPSHWRRALMTGEIRAIAPHYVRLSGEIADQAILDSLAGIFPSAKIAHAFASTEVGVVFEIEDRIAGFPADFLERGNANVALDIRDGSLCVRSDRMALRYLGSDKELKDGRGSIDTGDLVEAREGRYYFRGRRTGIINVGGLKVHPEEVEAVINGHPAVQMCQIIGKASPITGAIVVAQILLRAGLDAADLHTIEDEVAAMCRRDLPPHKVPVRFNFVTSLEVGASGKLVRNHA
jgi:acyl-CoA synthetase (AMP-forming)/AMP-acid ligase II